MSEGSSEGSGKGGAAGDGDGNNKTTEELIAEVKSGVISILNEKADEDEVWNTTTLGLHLGDLKIVDALGINGNKVPDTINYLIGLLGSDDDEESLQNLNPDIQSDIHIYGDESDGTGGQQVLPDLPYFSFSRLKHEFDIEEKFGGGGYGKVFRCKHKIDKQEYAVKRIKITMNGQTPMEVYALAVLQHPHIVQYHQAWVEPPGSYDGESEEDQKYSDPESTPPHGADGENKEDQSNTVLCIQMQFCPEELKSNDKEFSKRLFLQILHGISFMHKNRIAHCDLKPDNIRLDKKKNARICDFGLAHFLDGAELDQNIVIVPLEIVDILAYRAPELLQSRNNISEKTDIYSLGVIAVHIFSRHSTITTVSEISNLIMKLKRREGFPFFLEDEPEQIKNIFLSMVAEEPSSRPHAAEVLNALTLNWGQLLIDTT